MVRVGVVEGGGKARKGRQGQGGMHDGAGV